MTGTLQTKKLKDGEYFYVVLYLYENGKRKPKWVPTGLPIKGNKKRADQMLRDTLREHEQRFVSPEAHVLYLDWVGVWLREAKKRVDGVTHANYKSTAELYVIPYFKSRGTQLGEITRPMLQKYVDEMHASGRVKKPGGLSPTTLGHIRNVLSQSLKAAVRNNLLPTNPCEGIILPQKERRDITFYTADQLNALLQAAKEDTIYPLPRVVTVYGLRRSELLGLRWDSVDFGSNMLSIKYTVVQYNGLYEKAKTKNLSSRRSFPLLPDIREMLIEMQKQEQEYRRLFGGEYQDNPYIFKWPNGAPFSPDYVSHRFLNLLKQNNLPRIRFHDLRHSCASLLIAQGFGLKDVQEWLGHADITMTANVYAHLDMKRKQSIADSLAGSLSVAWQREV